MTYKVLFTSRESVQSAVAKTRKELGEVTLLINNAGIMPCKLLLNHRYTISMLKNILR